LGLKIHNLMGQVVYEVKAENVIGPSHQWEINTRNYKPGVYFYSVIAEGNQVTKKMIVD